MTPFICNRVPAEVIELAKAWGSDRPLLLCNDADCGRCSSARRSLKLPEPTVQRDELPDPEDAPLPTWDAYGWTER